MAELRDQPVTVWFIPNQGVIYVTDGLAVPQGVNARVDSLPTMTRREAERRGLVTAGVDFEMVRRGEALQYAGRQVFLNGYHRVKVLWFYDEPVM